MRPSSRRRAGGTTPGTTSFCPRRAAGPRACGSRRSAAAVLAFNGLDGAVNRRQEPGGRRRARRPACRLRSRVRAGRSGALDGDLHGRKRPGPRGLPSGDLARLRADRRLLDRRRRRGLHGCFQRQPGGLAGLFRAGHRASGAVGGQAAGVPRRARGDGLSASGQHRVSAGAGGGPGRPVLLRHRALRHDQGRLEKRHGLRLRLEPPELRPRRQLPGRGREGPGRNRRRSRFGGRLRQLRLRGAGRRRLPLPGSPAPPQRERRPHRGEPVGDPAVPRRADGGLAPDVQPLLRARWQALRARRRRPADRARPRTRARFAERSCASISTARRRQTIPSTTPPTASRQRT